MATVGGGGGDNPPPSRRDVSEVHEVSGSWMNLAASHNERESRFPRRAKDIMSTLKMKQAILSGGRDEQGRVIITFPARPKGMQYDHTQLLQTLQYLSSIPSPEVSELGFVVIVDGRLLTWTEIKLILRTAQEALPGQVQLAYVIQPTQFMHKQQMAMSLAKEKDRLEFGIVKLSSMEKLTKHLDQRQVTFDLAGLLNYNHDEWLSLRTNTEELIDVYQSYIEQTTQLEFQLKSESNSSPERLVDIQSDLSRLEALKTRIDAADVTVRELGTSLKNGIETNSGSTGLTPEMVNCLAAVNKILVNTNQQQSSLLELYQQHHRVLDQSHSLKQFDLGLKKVLQWITNKGLEKASRVDIGDSISSVLSIQDDFRKLESKVESMAADVTEIKRMADVMQASEHYAHDKVGVKIRKLESKYSKFKAVFEQRKKIVSSSVVMYKGISEWRQLHDDLTTEWGRTNILRDVDSAQELLDTLETQQQQLRDIVQNVLSYGQNLVKLLKESDTPLGDADFRKSLRYISRVTEEVTEKSRKTQEVASARRARLDQYSQLLVCERDAQEGIKNLHIILSTFENSHGGIGTTIEAVVSLSAEIEQYKDDSKRNHEYSEQLLLAALLHRETLGDKQVNQKLRAELNSIATRIYDIIKESKHRLDLAKRLYSVYEPTQAIIQQWMETSPSLSKSTIITALLKEMKERENDVVSSLTFCKDAAVELLKRMEQPISGFSGSPTINESTKKSINHLESLLQSLEEQRNTIRSAFEEKRRALEIEERLITIEQAAEDILIWLREHGLSLFSGFLSLGFTLGTVQDQWMGFLSFRDTCQSLSKQVVELEDRLKRESSETNGGTLNRVTKRVNDLERVWKRFLLRVENRENVLSSLHQFLSEAMNLASVMSESLKSSASNSQKDSLESTYQSTMSEGDTLIELLRYSPDGTQDSYIADRITERLEQLSDLHNQLIPFLTGDKSNNKEEVKENERQTKNEEQRKQTSFTAGIKRIPEKVKVSSTLDTSVPMTEKQEKCISSKLLSSTEQVPIDRAVRRDVYVTSEQTGLDSVKKSNSALFGTNTEKGRKKNSRVVKSEEKPLKYVREETKEGRDVHTKSENDSFKQVEEKTDKLLQDFFHDISQFIKSHDTIPTSVEQVDEERRQHEEFLEQKRRTCDELNTLASTLKSFVAPSLKNKAQYLVDKIEGRMMDRSSLLERRIAAMKLFTALCHTKEKCENARREIDTVLSIPLDQDVSAQQEPGFLDKCDAVILEVDSLTQQCGNKTREFTGISSELEMSGADARRIARQIRREMENAYDQVYRQWQKRKSDLAVVAKKEKLHTDLQKILSWINEIGMPFVDSTKFGNSSEECQTLLRETEQITRKSKLIAENMKSSIATAKSLETSKMGVVTPLQKLSKQLESTLEQYEEKLVKRQSTLHVVAEFFSAAEMLINELELALSISVGLTRSVNPIVVDKTFSLLRTQAKEVYEILQVPRDEDAQQTVESVNKLLKVIEKMLSKYLLVCSRDSEDYGTVLAQLDDLLTEIEADVQLEKDIATSKPSQEVLKIDSSKSDVKTTDSQNPSSTESIPINKSTKLRSQEFVGKSVFRRGTVQDLKKLFESEDETSAKTQRSSLSVPERNTNTHTFPPRHRVTATSTVISPALKITSTSTQSIDNSTEDTAIMKIELDVDTPSPAPPLPIEKEISSPSSTPPLPIEKQISSPLSTPPLPIVKEISTPLSSPPLPIVKQISTSSSTPPLPIVKQISTPSSTPPLPIEKQISTPLSTPPLPIVKEISSPSSTPPLPIEKQISSPSSTPPLPIVKEISSPSSTPPLPIVKQISTSSSTPPLPIVKQISTPLSTPPLPIVKQISTPSSTPPLPIEKQISSPSSTPPLPIVKEISSPLSTPPLPIVKQISTPSSTPPPTIPPLPIEEQLPTRPPLPIESESDSLPPTPPPPLIMPVRPPLPLDTPTSSFVTDESVDDIRSSPPNSQPDVKSLSDSQPDVKSQSDSQPDVKSQSDSQPDVKSQSDSQPDIKSQSDSQVDLYSHTSSPSPMENMSSTGESEFEVELNKSGDSAEDTPRSITPSIDEMTPYIFNGKQSPVPPTIQPLSKGLEDISSQVPGYNDYLDSSLVYSTDECVHNGDIEPDNDKGQSHLHVYDETVYLRDLSPVFEEVDEEEHGDRPDIGLSHLRKRQKQFSNDEKAQLVREQQQSLASMKSIIADFYKDEVRYTEKLSNLMEVYSPILHHTGIFKAVFPIADFQPQFLKQLSESLSSITDICSCFQQNIEFLKLYFPFVMNYDNGLQIISQCDSNEMATLTAVKDKSNGELIVEYTAPYQRLEIYCSFFQQLLRSAFKEDLMNLAALSETLESLLDLLRQLAMELATTKLQGCPFQVAASEIIAMNPFLVHLDNKVKDVCLYTVFLHPQYLIITERHLDEPKEHTQYSYIMHIPISGMLLIENYHGIADCFAVCEQGQATSGNMVVFKSCEDISVKDYWVMQLKSIMEKEIESLTPRETLKPEQVEELGHLIPKHPPPRTGLSERLEPLRRKRSFKRVLQNYSNDSIDGYEPSDSPTLSNVYRVVMDPRTAGVTFNDYLDVKENDLVEVLEKEGVNYLVSTIPSDSSEDEEGYVPSCCLEPLMYSDSLNHNANNNAKKSDVSTNVNPAVTSSQYQSDEFHNGVSSTQQNITSESYDGMPSDALLQDWAIFCMRTGSYEAFPDCKSEDELLYAKMERLAKYHSDQSHLLMLSENLTLGYGNEDTELDNEKSETMLESSRKLLYKAEFLEDRDEETPTHAQLNGVFSLRHPYAAMKDIKTTTKEMLSLRQGQLVKVLDSKRDDWWLVSTFPECDMGEREGWVPHHLLQHAEYIREDVTEADSSTPSFSIPLWLTLADYNASDEGTISIKEGELVEVIDNSRNKWSLVRTLGRQAHEGWIPTEYIIPYNFSESDASGSPISLGIPIHPSSAGEDSVSSNEGTFDASYPLSPTLSVGELDSEEKRKEAAEYRDCTLSELLGSEREYIERLEYCITHYKTAIESTSSNTYKTLRAVSGELFINIEEIYYFHKEEVLPRLESCQENQNALVDLFSLASPQLKSLYVTYCKGTHRSKDIYREYLEYLQELRDQFKDRLSLRDYLILPVQRITKYNLLLKNFLEFSIKAGHPVPHFKTALGATYEISRQANNAVHMSMIEGIPKRLHEFGELVLQDVFGVSEQQQRGLFKERRTFLFEKAVVITKRKSDAHDRESYITKEIFLLNEISIGEDVDNEKRNIAIYEMATGNKFTLKASNTKCRDEWLKRVNELTSVSKKLTLGNPLLLPSRSRSVSEPVEINQPLPGTQGPLSLLRQGSQKLRRSGRNISSRPSSASCIERTQKPELGSRYIVMECIVLEGGDDLQLQPGEEVELVRVESSGSFRVRTVDEHSIEGAVLPGFLRKRESVKGDKMETAPRITVSPPSDLTQSLHDNVSISCAFNGSPIPEVIWKRDEENLVLDNRIKATSCPTSSVLIINNVQYFDEGQYSCTVTNPLGSDVIEMDLFVEGPPSCPSKPHASKVTGTSVKLKWSSPEYNGHNPILSYTVEQLQEGFGEWQPIVQQSKNVFVVRTLNPNTWYQFRIIARNEIGESEPSEPSEIVNTTRRAWQPFLSPIPKRKSDSELSKGTDDVIDRLTPSPLTQEDLSRTSSPFDVTLEYPVIRNESFSTTYDLLPEEIGRGRYGIVHKCVHKQNGSALCAKYLKESDEAINEVKILNGLCKKQNSHNLIQFVDAISTETNIVIITDFIAGVELVECILAENCLTEGIVVGYLQQLLHALEYIHFNKVIHLDIKPENLLLTADDHRGVLKLIDFGSAHYNTSLSSLPLRTLAHSLEFCAPEVVSSKNITALTDMWSVGVLAYILLSGVSPFFIENTSVLMQRVVDVDYNFNTQTFQQVSPEAKDFITSLLKKTPTQRLSAASAVQHTWITTLGTVFVRHSSWPMPTIDLSKLKAFRARRKLQTSVIATQTASVFSSHRSPHRSPVPGYINTSLNMTESPPILEEGTEEVQAPINATITLEWSYTGYPNPSIVWEHENRKVTSSGRVSITSTNGLTQLTISGVVRSDEGVYICCALNSLGSDIQECRLVVMDKPSAPSSITAVLLGDCTSALVSWLPPVNCGNSPVTHYVLQNRQIEYDEWDSVDDKVISAAHVVDHLLPGMSYVFRVAAVNLIGSSLFSKPSSPIYIATESDSPPSTPALNDIQLRISDLSIEYDVHTEIGRGTYGVVYECTEKSTDRLYAAKYVSEKDKHLAIFEYEFLKKLNHPRIINLEDAFDIKTHIVLILEYVPCGDLQSLITPLCPLDELQAARFTRHITEGLQYLHNLSIIHVNIAPENLLLAAGHQEIKIGGFSLARYIETGNNLESLPLSPEYMAPEVVQLNPLTTGADMWSVGATVLFMLTGTSPFSATTRDELVSDILTFRLSSECNSLMTMLSLSADCYDVVFKGLLVSNPRKRLTGHQCQRHRWLQSPNQTSQESLKRLKLNLMNTEEQMKYFMSKYPNQFQSHDPEPS